MQILKPHHLVPFRNKGQAIIAEEPADSDNDWDSYWRTKFGEQYFLMGSPIMTLHHCEQWFSSTLRKGHYHRVLLPGNGISLFPHLLAHRGYTVTALDTSRLAARLVRESTFPRNLLAKDEFVMGGSVTILQQDVFSYVPEQPFDAIWDDRFFFALPPEVQPLMARRYAAWLQPNGICVLHALNMRERTALEDAFLQAGFEDWDTTKPTPGQRRVRYIHGSG